MPIIYIKGYCYETPLYGHVQSDKQDGDKGQGMRSRRSPWARGGGGEGVRRVRYCWSTITCDLAFPTTHHRISTIPRIYRSKLIFPFNQELAKFIRFAYCHIAYISFGSCKDCVKEPPLSPPSSHFTHPPSPVYYTFALWTSGHGFSFFPRFLCQTYFTKEVVVFWRQC